jgi:hypothetical protein
MMNITPSIDRAVTNLALRAPRLKLTARLWSLDVALQKTPDLKNAVIRNSL